jgi:hypothetical protein
MYLMTHICVIGSFTVVGCLSKSKPVAPSPGLTRVEKIQNFVTNSLNGCSKSLTSLEGDAESSVPDINTGRGLWRSARDQYEQVRFFVEEFYPVYHSQNIAPWFSSDPRQGFHFIEISLFSSSPDWAGSIKSALEGMNAPYVQVISGSVTAFPVPDSGVFHGLLHMLADIDTVKFTGKDEGYSGNSGNDVFSNYTGLDTIYSYYADSVYNYSPVIDSTLKARWKSAWDNTPTDSSRFYAMDRKNYDSLYLHPLEDAVKQIATVFGVQIQ